MAKKQEKQVLTRAQKTEAAKGLFRELLAVKPMRHNELIDEVAKLYQARYEGEDTENVNDVKGRVGSVLDIMKKESDVMYDGGMYALKARVMQAPPVEVTEQTEEKEVKKPTKRTAKKKEEVKIEPQTEEAPAPAVEETPVPKKRGRRKKEEAVVAEEKTEAKAEEKPVKKTAKRTVKKKEAKTEEPVVAQASAPVEEKAPAAAVETPVSVAIEALAPVVAEEKKEERAESKEIKEEKKELIVKPKAELAQKGVVMDMSFLFGDKASKTAKPAPRAEKAERVEEKKEERVEKPAPTTTPAPAKKESVQEKKSLVKAEKPAEVKGGEKPEPKSRRQVKSPRAKVADKPMTAEEKLRESYLKRMRILGGDYFEYYSVYLLERYCMKNGRRLEGLHISGGDHDGGIDGEIELTDKFGFKETIYIQSKNWDPDKGKEENWVVGETLLQQFIGACACRQAKDGKQHCRGIFVTTSRFTPDAKRILEDMSDKIVGYDGNDLFEAAKECGFGVIKKNGEWVLDENLLSGTKAFFQML